MRFSVNLYVLVIISLFSAQVFQVLMKIVVSAAAALAQLVALLHITRDMGGRVRASKNQIV